MEKKKLYNQICDLKTRKNGDQLVEHLRQRINDGVIYTTLKESEVNEVFKSASIGGLESLNEAVTFVDNAGNVKTTSAEEYNKQMHEYDTETEIEKYKKSNKKKYKLLDENSSPEA